MEHEFFFPPYVGELYGKPESFFNEVRVMAIGNSHHCDTKFDHYHRCCEQCENYIPSCNNFTTDVVNDYISNPTGEGCEEGDDRWRRTFTKFANLLGANGSIERVWNSIVFYNFLQCAVPNSKAQGNTVEINRSKEYMLTLLTEYAPDVVIVWGNTHVYQCLPKGENWKDITDRTGIYTINGKNIRVACIKHPMICGYEYGRDIIKSIAPELYKK